MSLEEKLKNHESLIKPVTELAIERARKFGSTSGVSSKQNCYSKTEDEEEFEYSLIPPPKPQAEMFYGIVGDVTKAASDRTEINPVAAGLTYLSFLGANFGREIFLRVSNRYHHPRLFTAHIGRSGRGGKGDSQEITHRIKDRIEKIEPNLLCKTHIGGLSSREGLVALIADESGESPGVADKRLWVIENEFANVLVQKRREGNTLSSALRSAWDGDDLKPAVKIKPIGVTAPHIGIHCGITPSELKMLLSTGDMTNGFANRFLMIWSENVGCVPFPSPTSDELIDGLSVRTLEIIKFAKGGYPNCTNLREMTLNISARELYEQVYRNLRRPLDSDLLSAMLERRAPYALRLAMQFALTDLTYEIDARHLEAALSWVSYSIDSVKFIFSEKSNDPHLIETRKNANKIMEYLSYRSNGAGMRELINECFQKNTSSEKIKASLSYLLIENPPCIEQIQEPIIGRGRPKTTFKIKSVTDK